jgi:hypothetical protein
MLWLLDGSGDRGRTSTGTWGWCDTAAPHFGISSPLPHWQSTHPPQSLLIPLPPTPSTNSTPPVTQDARASPMRSQTNSQGMDDSDTHDRVRPTAKGALTVFTSACAPKLNAQHSCKYGSPGVAHTPTLETTLFSRYATIVHAFLVICILFYLQINGSEKK